MKSIEPVQADNSTFFDPQLDAVSVLANLDAKESQDETSEELRKTSELVSRTGYGMDPWHGVLCSVAELQ